MTMIFLHGSGHQAASWRATVSQMPAGAQILRPNLAALLEGQPARFENLCAAFARYCAKADTPLDLCGFSLGGILALAYTLEHPEKVRSLVLIGTPHKVPKVAFAVQNAAFRVLPARVFRTMAFDKADTFALGDSMKDLDFSAQVAQIHCPTLILCGEKDHANLASARFFAAHIPGAECDVIPGVGHIVNEEAPEALAARLETFYAALR